MIPLWAISAIGAGAVAGLAGYGLASRLGDAKLARAEAGWAQERRGKLGPGHPAKQPSPAK